jgi:hypothetical protein
VLPLARVRKGELDEGGAGLMRLVGDRDERETVQPLRNVWFFWKGWEDNIDLIADAVVEGERNQVAHEEPIRLRTGSYASHGVCARILRYKNARSLFVHSASHEYAKIPRDKPIHAHHFETILGLSARVWAAIICC